MYDILVIGAGHAGIEAALASSRMNMNTCMVTQSIENIGKMPCNPSVGGPAKGNVVREIDALGGQMGITADATAMQFKMLNTTKGPGVQSLRIQSDKVLYSEMMQEVCLNQPNLKIIESMVSEIIVEDNVAKGVILNDFTKVYAKCVILTTGTYMASLIMVSDQISKYGPDGEKTTSDLSKSLVSNNIELFRLKTGTPARVKAASIDFSKTEVQPGTNEKIYFSEMTDEVLAFDKQALCYLTYTTANTHKIILDNLKKSSMYSGAVKGVGPRYCPSIEDKLVRFKDKERHQIFLEPESNTLDTIYVQGFSTSMPFDIQEQMIQSLPGLENAVIDRYAYAIEYDAINPVQLKSTLELKNIHNLFSAGQINGTSGYEEAAGQGLMAGINAALKIQNKEPLILKRNEAYIGVMIDDLVTKGTLEPYRLLTSRAEFRLLLRHDNADQRLTQFGYDIGLVSEQRFERYNNKLNELSKLKNYLIETRFTSKSDINETLDSKGFAKITDGQSAYELIKRPHITCFDLIAHLDYDIDYAIAKQVEIECKYVGYIDKANKEASRINKMDNLKISSEIDYTQVEHLSLEGRQKLIKINPATIGQAGRISGVSPSDITMLLMHIENKKRQKGE